MTTNMLSMSFNISFLSIIVSVLCISKTPCYLNDDNCLVETFKIIHKMITEGVPSLGIKDLDVIYQDKVVGIVPTLNYTLTNAEMLGMKKCEVKRVKIDIDQSKFVMNLLCSKLIIRGHYDLVGEVLSVHVRGNGNFTVASDFVDFTFYATSEKMKGADDDKEYYKIKDLKQIVNSKGRNTYDVTNVYKDDQKQTDTLLKSVDKYWKQVSQGRQDPAISGFLKVYITNINKYLEKVPSEQLFIHQV